MRGERDITSFGFMAPAKFSVPTIGAKRYALDAHPACDFGSRGRNKFAT